MGRTDAASRVIKASPQKIYAAHVDPQALAAWRPPQGMRAEIYAFDAREGGGYRMALVYEAADHAAAGKSTADADAFEGRFVELVPNERIVEVVEFESDDPAFAGAMTVRTILEPVTGRYQGHHHLRERARRHRGEQSPGGNGVDARPACRLHRVTYGAPMPFA